MLFTYPPQTFECVILHYKILPLIILKYFNIYYTKNICQLTIINYKICCLNNFLAFGV